MYIPLSELDCLWFYKIFTNIKKNPIVSRETAQQRFLCFHVDCHSMQSFDSYLLKSYITVNNLIRIMECTYKYLLKTIIVIFFNLLVNVRKNFLGLPLLCFGVPIQFLAQSHTLWNFNMFLDITG